MLDLFKITDIFLVVIFASAGAFSGMKLTELHPSSTVSTKKEKDIAPPKRAPSLTRHITYISSSDSSRGRISSRMNGIIKKLLAGEYPENWELELGNILENSLSEDGSLEVLFLFFSKWAEQDLQSAWDHADKTYWDPFIFRSEIFSQLAAKDVKSALLFYEENKDLPDQKRLDLISSIASHWALQNPVEALKWGLSLEKESDSALISIMYAIGLESDRVMEFMDMIVTEKGYIPDELFIEWLALSPDEVLGWGEKIRDQRPNYTRSVLDGMAKNDVNRAISLFNVLPQSDKDQFASIIFKHIFSPETAMIWDISTGSFPQIGVANSSPLDHWSYADSVEAEARIQRLDSPSIKDAAIKIYVDSVPPHQSYDNVIKLMNEISDANTKHEAMQIAAKRWKVKNPD